MDHLSNIQFYERLLEDPTERFLEEITSYLMSMFERSVLDQDMFEFLRPKDIRTSQFDILPKLHKPGTPGRPIVSCCGAPTEGISKFVDHHLSPLVKNIPSYIPTSRILTIFFEMTWSTYTTRQPVGNINITSLYTNIPHEEGLKACREALSTRGVLDHPTEKTS